MSWYYIDGAGTTLGPVGDGELEKHWKNGTLTAQTYVWNGGSVNEWSLIEAVPSLHNKLKAANKPAPPRAGPPRGAAPRGGGAPRGGAPKAKKKAGGARINLLDSIRGGNTLKKVEKKDLPAAAGGSKGGSSGGGFKPKGGGKLSLQDQLKMKLGNRSKGAGPKKKSGPVGGANKFAPKKTFGAKPKASPAAGGFGAKKATGGLGAKKATGGVGAAKNKFGGGAKKSGGNGGKMSKFEMKKAIDQCNDDWILKAITKLLS